MESKYITSKTKVLKIYRSFARDVKVFGKSCYISIPADIVREFGIEKNDLITGMFDCVIPQTPKGGV